MIKHPRGFTEAMPAGFDGLFDWDFLLPAFSGTKIAPTDIDGVVERHGKILLFETKAPGIEIKKGQEILLEALLKIGRGSIYLMVIYGKTADTIIGMEEWRLISGTINKAKISCDSTHVLKRVRAWFDFANTRLGV